MEPLGDGGTALTPAGDLIVLSKLLDGIGWGLIDPAHTQESRRLPKENWRRLRALFS